MVGDPLVGEVDVEVAPSHQLGQELGVVDHLVLAAELSVVAPERGEAVGALGDDLGDLVAVERLDVLHRRHLEQVFVARPPGRITGALLPGAEDGVVHARRLEQGRHRLGDGHVPVIERACAPHPIEELGGVLVLAQDRDVDGEVLGPVGP